MGAAGSKYNKSGVLTGQLDAYCLVCEAALEHTALEDHILLETHSSNLAKNSLVEKYKKECVRKVPNGYYCQLCNIFLRSLAKVKIHIADTVHQNSKTSGSNLNQPHLDLAKEGGSIVAFGCLNIDVDAWNAIGKETCFVCDEDLKEGAFESHIELSSHKINLIQVFAVQSGWFLYRKIGESSMQCLTCNQIVTEPKLQSHFNSKNHEVLFNKACNGMIKKQDVSCYDINKNLKIKNYHAQNNNICLVCNAVVEKNNLNSHINNYHHKNMVKLHEQWIERKKWVTEQPMPAIPLTFEEKLDDNDDENSDGWKTESSDDESGDTLQDFLIKMALNQFLNDSNKKAKSKKNDKVKVENINGNDKENKTPNIKNKDDSEYHTADENGDGNENNEKFDKAVNGEVVPETAKNGMEVEAKDLVKNTPKADTAMKDDVKKTNGVPQTETEPKMKDVPKTGNKPKMNMGKTKNKLKMDIMPETENDPKLEVVPKTESEPKMEEPKQDKVSKEEFDKVVVSCMKDFKKSGGNSDKVNHNKEILNKAKRDEVSNGVQEDQTIFEYADEYSIKYHPKGITTCTVCDIQLKGTLEDMKGHVSSFKHKRNYFKTSKITPNNYDTVRMPQTPNMALSIIDVVNSSMMVNNRHSISYVALVAMTREGVPAGYMRCHLCSKTVRDGDGESHVQSDLHQRLQRESRIVTSFENDYVREVRHGVYQCGYCNQYHTSWEALLHHLMGGGHRRQQLAAQRATTRHIQSVVARQVEHFMNRD